MKWKFTVIHHIVRIAMNIKVNEYIVFDIIFKSQSHPDYAIDGYCDKSYRDIAKFTGLSVGTIHGIIERGVNWGLVQISEDDSTMKRMLPSWYNVAYLDDIAGLDIKSVRQTNHVLQKSKRSETEQKGVQKLNKSVQKLNGTIYKKESIKGKHSKDEKIFAIGDQVELTDIKTKKLMHDFNHKLESITGVKKHTLPPEEIAIMAALDKCKKYFENYPDMIQVLKAGAQIKKSDINFDFDHELQAWVRTYSDSPNILKNITRYISNRFASFLRNYNRLNKGKSKPKKTEVQSGSISDYKSKYNESGNTW